MRYVVIIGAARSGTKLLRGLLEASPEVRAIPYDVNFIWRQGLEDRPDDVLLKDDMTPGTAANIRNALIRAARAQSENSVVLEKTVSNTLRVEFVNEVLPDAYFVHLIRDGRDVAESAARMWQAPPDLRYLLRKFSVFPLRNAAYGWWYLKNLAAGLLSRRSGVRVWGPRYPGIDTDAESMPVLELCATQWRESVTRALVGLTTLSADRVFTLKYEDLVRDPAELQSLCEFAGLSRPDQVLERHAQTIRVDNVGKWRRTLSSSEQNRLSCILGSVLDQLGYE